MKRTPRTALVTGGSQRVGRAIALELALRGYNVAITYRASKREAERTVQDLRELKVQAAAFRVDLTHRPAIQALCRKLNRSFGGVDVLVNNAAIFEHRAWSHVREADWDRHLDTNLRAAFFCAQALAPGMIRRRWGRIINLIDPSAERAYPGYIPYSASKAGLMAVTQGLARALAPHVLVNAVSLGPILLPKGVAKSQSRWVAKTTLLKRMGTVEDVATAVGFLVEEAPYTTGSVIDVDGGALLR